MNRKLTDRQKLKTHLQKQGAKNIPFINVPYSIRPLASSFNGPYVHSVYLNMVVNRYDNTLSAVNYPGLD